MNNYHQYTAVSAECRQALE